MDRYDVVIAGCGPVGAVAANLFGHLGLATLVIEKTHEPYTLPRAIHFDQEIMRIFQSAGMAEALLPHLSIPAGAMYFGANGKAISQFRANVTTDRFGWATSYNFYQPDLERALRDQFSDRSTVRLVIGQSVQQVTQDADGVRVSTSSENGPMVVEARYLIACDGGRSTVRKQIGGELTDLGFDEPWIVVDTFIEDPIDLPQLHGTPEGIDMRDALFIMGDPARPTSVIPGVGKHRRFEFMLLPDEDPADYNDPARVASLIEPFVKGRPHEIIRCAVYRFHALLAERWQVGRVFLAGDAAHQTPPFYGQGMCHGIRDVANLAWKLKLVLEGVASPLLLDTYQPERLPQVRSVVEASMRAGQNLCTLDPARAAKRDEEMGAIAARTPPGYVDLIPPITSGVLGTGSAAGARFIQPPMVSAKGVKGLLDDLTGGGFVILGRDATVLRAVGEVHDQLSAAGLKIFFVASRNALSQAQMIPDLIDVTGELSQWFDYHTCAGVVLRPDAYVYGTFESSEDLTTLLKTLIAQLDIRKTSYLMRPLW
ncbi:bifunctional 3-(3-hydroxy-phenyl)propionate/3-hydroxycinnamic acid hydroxylase [Sphingomonas sp.]|uniref:bifunctional 3-(3-hydroxy-phenyl)propionate/3-hydroxycinnamic acid hydroxylase MhpA n=1 Tax=Sphingomonas sp. TaxID=28214 RepID=UPI0025E2B8AB|nr:bifunctional 3-(3-hydroxy-phenyl)propionate/3-hydroxycinnamic acid hydroxylase [Sphingomonas sp.]